ncbi:MAG: sigma-70 family RNA polymerase sigma factor [Clostridiales bacterium]|nr:sigma-70 family RNA polymerase sigma factor [Clostridiales bacterium]
MDKKTILEKAHPLIISSINKYALSKDEFEDLYQEGVLMVLELLDKYDGSKGVDLFYYLKVQLRFFYLNYERYKKKTMSLNEPIGDDIVLMDTLIDQHSNAEEIMISKWEYKTVYKAFQSLDSEDKFIIEQSIIMKRTLDDLAKELGISRTTLFRRRRKILERISDKLR